MRYWVGTPNLQGGGVAQRLHNFPKLKQVRFDFKPLCHQKPKFLSAQPNCSDETWLPAMLLPHQCVTKSLQWCVHGPHLVTIFSVFVKSIAAPCRTAGKASAGHGTDFSSLSFSSSPLSVLLSPCLFPSLKDQRDFSDSPAIGFYLIKQGIFFHDLVRLAHDLITFFL